MNSEEIRAAAADGTLLAIEDVDPSTATTADGYIMIGGRVVMPLDGLSWSIDRSDDLQILDELGASLGILCVTGKQEYRVNEMTRWQYTAYLVDCDHGSHGSPTHRFSSNYAVIDAPEFQRYVTLYKDGSALWGGFHHGMELLTHDGWRDSIIARPNIQTPTIHHGKAFHLITIANGPREEFLKIYHTIELLFDYITFRKIVKCGDDLLGFGKTMQSTQKSELDKLKYIFRDFCHDISNIADTMKLILPYLDSANDMFQIHTKEGNPLNDNDGVKWENFKKLIEGGQIDINEAKKYSVAGSSSAFESLIINLAAYQIYRIRSSIAHSRIGEYLLTETDDTFISRYGIPLIQVVAIQIFGSATLADLMTP